MKKLTLLFLSLLCLQLAYAQSKEEQAKALVKEGVKLHDEEQYDEAIKKYEEALKIDPKSYVALHEICFTYQTKKDYKMAIKYAERGMKLKNQADLSAFYGTKADCLDDLGKRGEALALYEKAIAKYPNKYLLYFNHALALCRVPELDKAEEQLIKAIQLNAQHISSHWLLAKIKYQKSQKSQGLLANYFVLMLERPQTNRIKEAFAYMQKAWTPQKGKEGSITINITSDKDADNSFIATDLLVGLQASKENKIDSLTASTPEARFVRQTKSFFGALDEKNESNKGFWWEFYVKFFAALHKANHTEAFCHYISWTGGDSEVSAEWLKANEAKVAAFLSWLKTDSPLSK